MSSPHCRGSKASQFNHTGLNANAFVILMASNMCDGKRLGIGFCLKDGTVCERKMKGGGRCRLLLLLSHNIVIMELLGRGTRGDLIPVQRNLQEDRAETFVSES